MNKKILKYLFLILMTSFSMLSCAESEVALRDTSGASFKKDYFKNKWVIINYWAEWCDSCREEIPELNRFYRNNKNSNVVMYGVNYDNLSPDHLKNVMRKMQIKFPVLLNDPNVIWGLGDVGVLPMTFLINPQGIVVKRIVGQNSEKSLLKLLKTYIE